MRLIREGITSFAGGVNDSASPDEYLAYQAQLLINARPSLLGNAAAWSDWAEPRSHAINFGSFATFRWYESGCFGATEFVLSDGTRQIVAIFDTAAYYSTNEGRDWTAISGATGFDEQHWSFAVVYEGGSPILCAANGGSSAYQWDGTTWSTISGIPAGVKYLAVHGNRLIAAGDSGAQVSASKVGDIDTWAIPDGWVVNANDGSDDDEITGLFSIGGVILVFKRRSFGYIEGYGYTTLQVAAGARGISRSVGCIGFRTIAPLGDQGLVWLSERGFEHYQLGGQVTLISSFQERFVDKINMQAMATHPGVASAIWLPGRQEYWCAVPLGRGAGATLGGSRTTWIYVYRPPTAQRPAAAYFRYPTASTDSTLTIDATGMLDISDSDLTEAMGFVDDSGMLDICYLPDPGLWMQVDGLGMLEFKNLLDSPATLFTADDGPRTAEPFCGTYDNSVLALDRPYKQIEMVRNGDFSASDEWTTTNVTIGSGVATFSGTSPGSIHQLMPFIADHTYRVTFQVSGRTAGSLSVIFGGTKYLLSVSENGVFEVSNTPPSTIHQVQTPSFQFFSNDGFDGVIDNVSMVDVTGHARPQIAIVRTRPITYGDEFTRKKAKRVSVLSKQSLAHTATLYMLTDGSYGTARSLAFTAASAPQEKRARVGGRARIIQAELHLNAACLVDGIEVMSQPLRDQE